MHLLHTRTLELQYFGNRDVPPYAILSHRWEAEEVTFQDVQSGNALTKAGYSKLEGTCSLARSHGFEYAWIDTCCIDKTSSAELTEAINSMFHWYREATVCYVYLSDVRPLCDADESNPTRLDFQRSRWFTRGWTLQELLAPAMIIFFDQAWEEFGTKASLSSEISRITTIPEAVLQGTQSIDEISIATRMSWAAYRDTARVEDIAYCLLGIFNVNMPIMYGERERAFMRLQEEIIKVTDDHSVFAWNHNPGFHPRHSTTGTGMHFAYYPFEFLKGNEHYDKSILVDNQGIHFKLPLRRWVFGPKSFSDNNYFVTLPSLISSSTSATPTSQPSRIGIRLSRVAPGLYTRSLCEPVTDVDLARSKPFWEKVCIKRVHPQLSRAAGEGLLMLAAILGNAGMVDLLLRHGADAPDWTGRALGDAAQWGNPNVVQTLLDRNADCNTALPWKHGRGPLSVAAEGGHVAVMEILLKNGAHVDARDVNGRTALSWGVYSKNVDTVRTLLDRNAGLDIEDHNGRTPLSWAAQYGNQAAAELLLAKGASWEGKDVEGLAPVNYAREYNNKGVVELLVSHAAADSEAPGQAHRRVEEAYDDINAEWDRFRVPTALERIVTARRKSLKWLKG
ncbi:ankyrin repeat-containing domain protein [Echria macrotheca]|uniref:Ankyrin repeat-containing domain protein n=1 Tax=Echria macrotheca TaxID=438768 RepID=A0AAJ0BLA6_9PEZI|nr:ankyrin repeat-containing domain protein [Echria macrotheca]